MRYSISACILSLLVAMVGIGCQRQGKQQRERDVLPVEVYVVGESRSSLQHSYVGEVEAARTTPLSFALGGRVSAIHISSHQHVCKGDALIEVDNTQAKNALSSAEALLRQAQDGYDRLKQVYDEGGVAEVQWIDIQTQLQKARSMVAIAEKEVEDCILRAPADGVLGECMIQEGQLLVPGQKAVSLMQIDRVNIRFSVPETEIGRIQKGEQAEIEIAAIGKQVLRGTITEKGIAGNRLSHSYEVKIGLDNMTHALMPGMVCKVLLPQPEQSGYVLPASCVQTRQEGLGVWVVRQGKAERRGVASSAFVQDGVLVSEGIAAGDSVVVRGYQKLYNGAAVRAVQP